jgi:hypothetical protein
MNRPEWIEVVKRYRANWPHAQIPDASIAKWYDDLAELPAEQVTAAVEAIYREGAEFPPNGAQVLAKVSEVERSDPDHGEAWRLAMEAVRRFGSYEPTAALEWLGERSAAVRVAVERIGYRELCHFNLADEATWRAQFREVYKAVVRSRKHDAAYASMGGMDPRQLRGGKPKRIGDVLAEIPEASS